MSEKNITPIFEWCDNKIPRIVNCENNSLILTALRNNITREYLDINDTMIPHSKQIKINNIHEFINEIHSSTNREGTELLNFFEHLEWTHNGEELWKQICEISQNNLPTILTEVLHGKSKLEKQYSQDKKNWCLKHLGLNINVITCESRDKYKYATSNAILIDDNIANGIKWEMYGGIFIHHIT